MRILAVALLSAAAVLGATAGTVQAAPVSASATAYPCYIPPGPSQPFGTPAGCNPFE